MNQRVRRQAPPAFTRLSTGAGLGVEGLFGRDGPLVFLDLLLEAHHRENAPRAQGLALTFPHSCGGAPPGIVG